MNWVDKALRKREANKLAKEILESEIYKEAKREEMAQSVLSALCRFCFIGSEYLEMKHGYKKNGIIKFIKFAKKRVSEIGDDEEYFKEASEYFEEQYGLDIMAELGLQFVDDEEGM